MAADAAEVVAEAVGLTYVNALDPGLTRRITSRGIEYLDDRGRKVSDERVLVRLRALVIPPAWTDVWICPDPSGHIQAVGRDARGRKQYRYHDDWRAVRDEAKYHRVCAFGRALPRLRRQVATDLRRKGLVRERVLAAVTRLLELTLIRVGNDEYARENQSFGLTTLRKRHMQLSGVGAVFEFRGKSGKTHRTRFQDRRLARVLRGCEELRGQRLFQYVDEAGERRPIESHDVNAYLREAMGEDFSAKDFRTWAGTLMAARALAMQSKPASEAEAKAAIVTCVKAVAGVLGNTSAVCRACYIHPAVLEAFQKKRLPKGLTAAGPRAELALIRLLDAAGACG